MPNPHEPAALGLLAHILRRWLDAPGTHPTPTTFSEGMWIHRATKPVWDEAHPDRLNHFEPFAARAFSRCFPVPIISPVTPPKPPGFLYLFDMYIDGLATQLSSIGWSPQLRIKDPGAVELWSPESKPRHPGARALIRSYKTQFRGSSYPVQRVQLDVSG